MGNQDDYETLDEETIYKGKVFDLVRVHFRLPNGKEPRYDLIKHHGAVTILPVDQEGRIWFVRQYRVGAQQALLELPAGLLEENEPIEISANRELQEEIGQAAGKLQKLGQFYMVPGYSTETLDAFLATDLYESSLPVDEDELLEKSAIPIQEVFEMVYRGEIQDGKTIATLLLARRLLSGMFGIDL